MAEGGHIRANFGPKFVFKDEDKDDDKDYTEDEGE